MAEERGEMAEASSATTNRRDSAARVLMGKNTKEGEGDRYIRSGSVSQGDRKGRPYCSIVVDWLITWARMRIPVSISLGEAQL
jgi:hypothetical protein